MKLITRLLTKNLQRVPLLRIDFNMKKFKEDGAKNSCMCVIHPVLKDDDHIIETLNGLCDYIREKYDMEKVI
ncbi:MAG: hypothetical protein NC124_20300 [Clostridium sp.]|nr:hypothetical protein [Ruminococcus flavefaciens]MCM1500806.1 hypothetical protein [Clostridium sp.]